MDIIEASLPEGSRDGRPARGVETSLQGTLLDEQEALVGEGVEDSQNLARDEERDRRG